MFSALILLGFLFVFVIGFVFWVFFDFFGGGGGRLCCLLRLTCDFYCVLKINRVFMTKCQIDATAVILLSTKGCKGC